MVWSNVVRNFKALGVTDVDIITNKREITKARYVEDKSNQMSSEWMVMIGCLIVSILLKLISNITIVVVVIMIKDSNIRILK